MDTEDIRLAVYRRFADTGRPPTPIELADSFGVDENTIRASLATLAAARHLVLSSAGDIVMAHPFSAVPLGFSVMGPSTLWWGGCAWDSFALPHLLGVHDGVLVATTCPGCGAAMAWTVHLDEPPVGNQVAHFLVPVEHMWDDVVHTCGNQRLFCTPTCVTTWLDRTGNSRGYVMDLATLWNLGAHWYDGRMDRGYMRREPASAREYLTSVGLTGPFWGS
jgi:Alkylmercury lyase